MAGDGFSVVLLAQKVADCLPEEDCYDIAKDICLELRQSGGGEMRFALTKLKQNDLEKLIGNDALKVRALKALLETH